MEGDDIAGLGLTGSQPIRKIRQKGPCVLCGTQRSTSWRKHYLVQGTICNKCYCRTARLVKNSSSGGGAAAEGGGGAAPRVPPPAAPPVLRPRPQPAPPHADDVTSHSHSHSFGRSQSYGQGQGQPHSRSLGSLLAALPQLTAAASHGEERYGAPPPPAYPRPHLPDAYRPSLLLGAGGQHPAGPQMTIAQAAAAFAPPPAERLSGLESLLDAILQTAAASDSAPPPPAAAQAPPPPPPPQAAEQLVTANLLVPLLSEALGADGDSEAQRHLAALLAAALAPGAPPPQRPPAATAPAAPAAEPAAKWEVHASAAANLLQAQPQPQQPPQARAQPQQQAQAQPPQPQQPQPPQQAQAEAPPPPPSQQEMQAPHFTPLHLQTPDWLRQCRARPSLVAPAGDSPMDTDGGDGGGGVGWSGVAGAALAGRLLALQEECWGRAEDPSEAACAASLAWHRCQLQLPGKQQQPLAALPRLGLVMGGGGASPPVAHPAGVLLLRVLLPAAKEQPPNGGQHAAAAHAGQPQLQDGPGTAEPLPVIKREEGDEATVLAVRLAVYGTAGVLLEYWDGLAGAAAAKLGQHTQLGRPFWDSGDGWGLAFPPQGGPAGSSGELQLFQAVLAAPSARLAAVPCCTPSVPQSCAMPPPTLGPFPQSLRQAQLALCAAPGAFGPQDDGPGERAAASPVGARQEEAAAQLEPPPTGAANGPAGPPVELGLQQPGDASPAEGPRQSAPDAGAHQQPQPPPQQQQQLRPQWAQEPPQQQRSWQQQQMGDHMVIDVQLQQPSCPSQSAGSFAAAELAARPAASPPAVAARPAVAHAPAPPPAPQPAGGPDPAMGLLLAALQSMPAAATGMGLNHLQSVPGLAESLGALLGGAGSIGHTLQPLQPPQHG